MVETYRLTREAVDRARAGGGPTLVELMTYRRKGHAEHDNQSYVPAGEIERWASENDPVDRYIRGSGEQHGVLTEELEQIDARVRDDVDRATDLAESSPPPEPLDALAGSTPTRPRCRCSGIAKASGARCRRTSVRLLGDPRWLRSPTSRPSARA